MKGRFKELRECSELPESLKVTLWLLINDWLDIVKYHRKRTFSMLLHKDLILNSRAPSSSGQYQVFFDEENTRFVDNKTNKLRKKERTITISSVRDSKVQPEKLAAIYFVESTELLSAVMTGAI